MVPLFEFVSVEPNLVLNSDGDVLRYLKLRYGFILLDQRTNGIISQIKYALDQEEIDREERETIDNDLVIYENQLSQLDTEDLLINEPSQTQDPNVPAFISMANSFSERWKVPVHIIVETSNQDMIDEYKKLLKHKDSEVITWEDFQRYEIYGKTANVIQNGVGNAKMLREILKHARFNRPAISTIGIVDHAVYHIKNYELKKEGKSSESEENNDNIAMAENYLSTIEETCKQFYNIYKNDVNELNLIPMNIKIFFRADCEEPSFINSFETYVIDKQTFFYHIGNKLNLTFYALKPNKNFQNIEKPPPVKNRYIFTNSFLIQQDVGILSLPARGRGKSYNEWTLLPKPFNERRPNDINLETVFKNFSHFSTNRKPNKYDPYHAMFEYKPKFVKIAESHQQKQSLETSTSNFEYN